MIPNSSVVNFIRFAKITIKEEAMMQKVLCHHHKLSSIMFLIITTISAEWCSKVIVKMSENVTQRYKNIWLETIKVCFVLIFY